MIQKPDQFCTGFPLSPQPNRERKKKKQIAHLALPIAGLVILLVIVGLAVGTQNSNTDDPSNTPELQRQSSSEAIRVKNLSSFNNFATDPSESIMETEDAKGMITATDRVVSTAEAARELIPSLGYCTQGSCVLGGFIRPSSSLSCGCPFEAGKVCVVLAAGDDAARDVDIVVTDPDGLTVAEDTETAASAKVVFLAEKSGQHRIVLRSYDTQSPVFCAAVVLEDGGARIPVKYLADAMANLITMSAAFNARLDMRLVSRSSDFALFGSLLSQGESFLLRDIAAGPYNHAVGAVGDADAREIDLTVTDSRTRSQIRAEHSGQPFGIVLFNGAEHPKVDIDVTLNESVEPSLVLAAMFEKR